VDAPHTDPLQREQAIRHLVARRCAEPLKLVDVAKALHLSPSRAAHVIKDVCGVGFVELLTAYRLRLAAEYLRHTDEPVGHIGRRAGFGDESHFYRVFKAKLGMTPRQYRRQRETR
jgi:AraC family transcriptional regulator of arabinose operon